PKRHSSSRRLSGRRRTSSSARSAPGRWTTSSARTASRSSSQSPPKPLAPALEAARARTEAPDPLLLIAPPGLGKTSLAYIAREELGVGLRTVAGPALERKGDVAAILTGLSERAVPFVD